MKDSRFMKWNIREKLKRKRMHVELYDRIIWFSK
jgi:hypothetical protein